jgi:hypothetical protein
VAKPVVDGIEKKLDGEAEIIRLDVTSRVGRDALRFYRVRMIPTLVVLDGCGEPVVTYTGIPDPDRVIQSVRAVPACTPVEDGS